MPLIYITGVPGTGKSTVRIELLRRGYTALGGAEDDLAAFYDNRTGERINRWISVGDRTSDWYAKHTWRIAPKTIEDLKVTAGDKLIFVCATTTNDTTELWELFDIKVALVADAKTLRRRLMSRTNNDVGKSSHELAAILERQKIAAETFTKLGAVLVDSTRPLHDVVDDVIRIANRKT